MNLSTCLSIYWLSLSLSLSLSLVCLRKSDKFSSTVHPSFSLCIWMLILYISVPPRLKIGGRLFLSCFSFCNSVWNFILANNFWTVNARVWYIIWVFLVTRLFCGYKQIWYYDLGVFPYIFKDFEYLLNSQC